MKTIRIWMMALAIAAIGAVSSPALAEGVQTFGVVDIEKIMRETDAAKGIFKELEGKRKEYQTQISKEEDTLRSAEKEIIKQRDTLSKEDFEKKRIDFEGKVSKGQQMVQQHKQTLDHAFSASMAKLRTEATKIVAEVAKEKGFSAVLTEEAVMLSVPEMDMTDEVVKRMNAKVKKIAVDWSPAKKK